MRNEEEEALIMFPISTIFFSVSGHDIVASSGVGFTQHKTGVIGISPPSYFALPGAKFLGKSPSPGRFP